MQDDSLIGTEVDGYRIQEVLGRGGMGVVYKATDTALSRDVALKRIDPSLANDETFLRRFRSEARALARIDSPYIVSVHALRQTEIGLLIVMEYVEGGTLKDLMREGPMDWQEALPIIKQMLTALEHAHGAEVIHRDIKPRNIMLSTEGTVKVTDFGLAKVHRSDSRETVTQGVHGTLNYMSPEQVQGGGNLDHRSDLYSLGMTVYEMLTGKLPFEEESNEFAKMRTIVEKELPRPDKLTPQVPDRMSALVMKALEKNPDDRFQSARVMQEAFEAFEQEHGTEDVQAASPEVQVEDSSPTRQWSMVAGLAALILLLAGGGYVLFGNGGLVTGGGPSPEEDAENGSGPPETSLSVSTSPSGAAVFLDGERVGNTPLPDTTIEGRAAPVQIRRSGYVPVDTTIELENRGQVELNISLTRRATPLRIRAEPWARVTLDGEDVGRTPLNRTVRKDTVRVLLERDGYYPLDTLVSLTGTPQAQLDLQLERRPTPQYGHLTLNVEPEGNVYVDGTRRSVGESVRVPAGEHQLRFQYGDYEKDTTLALGVGETEALTCYFRHRVVVQSDPVWASVYVGGENTGSDTEYEMEREPGTYEIEVRVGRGDWEVTGGEYRRSAGDRRHVEQFSGPVKTLTLTPSFERETHVIDFQLSRGGY